MSEDHKKQLERQLWNIADPLRGGLYADELRDYILGLISVSTFLKTWLCLRMNFWNIKLARLLGMITHVVWI